jgi:hypothetical protein
MIFGKPPGILQEVGIPINKIISGCNSYKNPDFQDLKVATLTFKFMIPLILRISVGLGSSEKE